MLFATALPTCERDHWQERGAGADFRFGKEPDEFLAACKPLLPNTGKVLAVAVLALRRKNKSRVLRAALFFSVAFSLNTIGPATIWRSARRMVEPLRYSCCRLLSRMASLR